MWSCIMFWISCIVYTTVERSKHQYHTFKIGNTGEHIKSTLFTWETVQKNWSLPFLDKIDEIEDSFRESDK